MSNMKPIAEILATAATSGSAGVMVLLLATYLLVTIS